MWVAQLKAWIGLEASSSIVAERSIELSIFAIICYGRRFKTIVKIPEELIDCLIMKNMHWKKKGRRLVIYFIGKPQRGSN